MPSSREPNKLTEEVLCFLRSTHKQKDSYKFIKYITKELSFNKILSNLDENSQNFIGSLEDEFRKLIATLDSIDTTALNKLLPGKLVTMISKLQMSLSSLLELFAYYKLHLRNFFAFLNT